MSVDRFVARLAIPRSTWYYWRAAHIDGRPHRRWPAPVLDWLEEPAAEQAHQWSAWGHRKIGAMVRADGGHASQSSVYRALKRRDLLQPARYQAERRQWAAARKKAFVEPPIRRNRVWQTDFTEFEVTSGSTWQIAPVADYAAKVVLAAEVSARKTGPDAVRSLRAAIDGAEVILGGTIAILMGVANRAEIAAELQAGGLAGDTPVAAVHAATTLRQEVVRCRLDELGCAAVRSPAVIVVGAVAALDIIGADAVGVTPGRSGHSAN